MPNKSLYALLIGINNYPSNIASTLKGCVADMRAWEQYLTKQCNPQSFTFKPIVLEDAAASKSAVIANFRHFQSATEGDVCVFAFCGHGTRVPTTDFWEPVDGKNEAIVCYDNCLTDKELSCLIYETMSHKKGVHFLSIMDSCHSGGNTRDLTEGVRTRLSDAKIYPQTIKDYYGFDKNYYISNGKGQYSAPKAQHINFGACRNHQTAKETIINSEFRGAFTSSLIEALETAHSPLSYSDLERRVAQKIANCVGDQLPLVDAVQGADPQMTFLGGAVAPKNRFFVSWNKKINAWELNAGAYHGIHIGSSHPSVIRLPKENILFVLNSVSSSTSVGKWQSDTFQPDATGQYDVDVQIGGGQARKIAFALDCDPSVKSLIINNLPQSKTNYIQLTDKLEEGEFFIHAAQNKIWLRRKGEDKPIFKPTEGYALVLDFLQKVNSVLQWFHVKNIENPATTIKSRDIEITLFRKEGDYDPSNLHPETMESITNWSNPTTYTKKGENYPVFALSIQNKSARRLFFSALYMTARFGIDNSYLPIQKLEPNETAWLSQTYDDGVTETAFLLGMDDALVALGLKEQMDYVKIMASTEEFDTSVFRQEPLNLEGTGTATRALMRPSSAMNKPDWVSFLLPLHIFNDK
ncbi:MAG: caspase family protein [Saprospiraceae bacterium]|nr:caspase family protein [Saprospiraceae bacterium]